MEKGGRLESLFQDRLPREVLEELTPEVRRQYFLWDEIMKREIELCPQLILPVIREMFQREYPAGREVTLLSTEYTVSRIHGKGEKLLHAIRSDLLLKIEGDLYHFECQIEKDGRMVFRMLEYDMHIALVHGEGRDRQDGFTVSLPRSAVLYLGSERNVPGYESCTIRFQDGTGCLYRVPVMKVQGYSLEEIEEKHLDLLIPFLPIRFRERIKRASGEGMGTVPGGKRRTQKNAGEETQETAREDVGRELTEFILKCIAVLDREGERGILPEPLQKDIGEFLWKACGYLLEGDMDLYREVSAKVEPAIKLSREIIQELRDDNRELQDDNRKLLDNIKEYCQKMEDASRRLMEKAKSEGKGKQETAEELAAVFALSEEAAEEKVRTYWKE